MHKYFLHFTFTLIFIGFAQALSAADRSFIISNELYQDVHFWRKIYSEIPSTKGYIHDDRHLNVIYETVDLADNAARSKRWGIVKQRIGYYRDTLNQISRKSRDQLSNDEKAVLSLWPADISNPELRQAAKRLRFQLGQADRFKEGLARSGRWTNYIKAKLTEIGVPVELAALPHVESSFNPYAYSHVGAAGMWQFMRATGRRYMQIDHTVDERLDPYTSSIAAAHLLKHNYESTGAWPLAITAYNHGTAGMRKAIEKTGGTDILPIIRHYDGRAFGFASRNFYVAFLAALDVSQNSDYYFGRIGIDAPEETGTIELRDYMAVDTITNALGISTEALKKYNLALRPPIWEGQKYVPRGYKLRLPSYLIKDNAEKALASISNQYRFAQQKPDLIYRVARGDTLSGIANRFNVRMSDLTSLNNLSSRHFIRIGQVIQLPVQASSPRNLASYKASDDGLYRVQKGDTLTLIARQFGIPENDLITANKIADKNTLHIGQKIRVAALDKFLTNAVDASPALTADTTESTAASDLIAYAEMSSVSESEMEKAEADLITETNVTDETNESSNIAVSAEDPSDYLVDENNIIKILPMETIGHYANWLEIPAERLRKINHHRKGNPVVIGLKLILDFSNVSRDIFEQRRIAYHRTVQESYFETYRITGTEEYTVKRNDKIWGLLKERLNIPLWLLLQYNPDLRLDRLHTGNKIRFPLVAFKAEQEMIVSPLSGS